MPNGIKKKIYPANLENLVVILGPKGDSGSQGLPGLDGVNGESGIQGPPGFPVSKTIFLIIIKHKI